MPDRYNWSEEDLKKVQFYVSEDIVLRRSLSKGESVISEGKIRLEEGRQIEEIIIESGTPGVLVFIPKKDRMAISFEKGSERYLIFGSNPKMGDNYALLAKNWDRTKGKVTYNGKEYTVTSKSAFASLMIDLTKVNSTKVKRRVAKGNTI